MKKIIVFVSLLFALFFVLGGCGGGGGSGSDPATDDPIDDPVLGDLTVSLQVTGLKKDMAAFRIYLNFDPEVLALDESTFHEFLGKDSALESYACCSENFGKLTLDKVSVLSPSELANLQSDGFPLVTLNFSKLSDGVYGLEVNKVEFYDVNGDKISSTDGDILIKM